MSTEAYEAGVEVALQEIVENLGEEMAEKVAKRIMGMGKATMKQRLGDAKGWLGKKYKGAKAHVSKHKGKYGIGAGAAGYAGGKAAYDKYNK